ncbi:hypothetical protein V6R85_02435 [Agrobacterium sp. CCNWLW32]|uniref:hypothetical protein n=1 Tax=Agrobacterium sp. CCNWLW32 TaxID=3122072 RepID=UPI0012DA615D
MIDYVWVVKAGDKYLANRIHRMTWTSTLIRAMTFLTEDAAERAAEAWAGEKKLVQLKEID